MFRWFIQHSRPLQRAVTGPCSWGVLGSGRGAPGVSRGPLDLVPAAPSHGRRRGWTRPLPDSGPVGGSRETPCRYSVCSSRASGRVPGQASAVGTPRGSRGLQPPGPRPAQRRPVEAHTGQGPSRHEGHPPAPRLSLASPQGGRSTARRDGLRCPGVHPSQALHSCPLALFS